MTTPRATRASHLVTGPKALRILTVVGEEFAKTLGLQLATRESVISPLIADYYAGAVRLFGSENFEITEKILSSVIAALIQAPDIQSALMSKFGLPASSAELGNELAQHLTDAFARSYLGQIAHLQNEPDETKALEGHRAAARQSIGSALSGLRSKTSPLVVKIKYDPNMMLIHGESCSYIHGGEVTTLLQAAQRGGGRARGCKCHDHVPYTGNLYQIRASLTPSEQALLDKALGELDPTLRNAAERAGKARSDLTREDLRAVLALTDSAHRKERLCAILGVNTAPSVALDLVGQAKDFVKQLLHPTPPGVEGDFDKEMRESELRSNIARDVLSGRKPR